MCLCSGSSVCKEIGNIIVGVCGAYIYIYILS